MFKHPMWIDPLFWIVLSLIALFGLVVSRNTSLTIGFITTFFLGILWMVFASISFH